MVLVLACMAVFNLFPNSVIFLLYLLCDDFLVPLLEWAFLPGCCANHEAMHTPIYMHFSTSVKHGALEPMV